MRWFRCLALFILGAGAAFAATRELGFSRSVTPGLVERYSGQFGQAARDRLGGWQAFIRTRTTAQSAGSDLRLLATVNVFFNRVPFVDDLIHRHVADYWASPAEMMASDGGDCEDFSIVKYFALKVSTQTVADPASHRRIIGLLHGRSDLAKRLVFEMTEFGAIQSPALSRDFAAEIRRLGAQFAIDHFSLHRDSLRQLHYLLPDYVKLAPEFTAEPANNQDTRFIVSSLMRIAEPLEIRVIAQAVESESLILLLDEMGFAGFQGYAGGRPEPIG